MRFDGKTTKRKITKFRLGELSAVPTGAQAPAKATIMKISANNQYELLQVALKDKYPKPEGGNGHLWVDDHSDSAVIYHMYDDKIYSESYVMTEEGRIVLAGDQVQVVRQTGYQKLEKSADDTHIMGLLKLAGFDDDQAETLGLSVDTDQPLDDQVAALATQFGKAATKTVDGKAYPASNFAYVPDPEKPSTWKLPIFDEKHVSAASAALGPGHRGEKVSIPEADRGKVLATVKAKYREHYPDKELPDQLKKAGDPEMSDPKTPEELQKELDAATQQIAELNVLAKMSDDEKSYMKNMSEEDRKAFMELSDEERKKRMKAQKSDDESFEDTDGNTITKSAVGAEAFKIMKSQNDRLAKMEEQAAVAEAMDLVKSICPELPGEPEAKAGALRKALSSLSEDEFEVLTKALKAGDAAMKVRKQPAGHQQPVGSGDAKKAFDDGIEKIMTDKGISKVKAMQSNEGLKLAKVYNEAVQETE